MLYTDYINFYEYVLPEVHGCPKAVAKNAIRDAVIEFCDKSQVWTAPSEDTDIVAGYSRYSFDARTDGAIVATIGYAAINDNPISRVSIYELEEKMPNWRYVTSKTPNVCFMDTSESMRLVGEPEEDIIGGLYVEVVLKPSRTSTECPQFLLENWAEAIAHGALARLKAMVGRPWADGQMVSYHRNEFRAGISRARSSAQKSNQTLSRTMKAKSFLEL